MKAQGNTGPFQNGDITTFVTFGDSTTDTIRVFNGGVQWPDYVAAYTGVKLIPFARSGSTCSNTLTPRPFNSLVDWQIPTYKAELANGSITIDQSKTLYTIWMGTNDIGPNSIISASNDASVTDVVNCLVGSVQALYDAGARNFLFHNLFPLEKAPIYDLDPFPSYYWHLERNTTEWHYMIRQLVDSVNELTKVFLENLAPRLSGAHVGIYDTHSMWLDIISNPGAYLNGTAPPNVTGTIKTCVYEIGPSTDNNCTYVPKGPEWDSYLWYDELHASEQADRHIARNVANIIQGKGSDWVNWLS